MSKVTMDDGVWQALKAKLEALDDVHVKVGVLANSGMHDSESGITMVELAAIHEFGSPAANIPERSFIRRTFRERADDLAKMQARLARAVVERGMPVAQALGMLGAWAAAQVKNRIAGGEHIPPPLKPDTIERKGSDRSLVDTGRLLGAISYEVGRG